MRHRLVLIAALLCSSTAFAQPFEASVSGGRSLFTGSSKNLGTVALDPTSSQYTMNDGFRLTFRMTLNSWRFMGHEFGYSYNHTSIGIPSSATAGTAASEISVPIHQGFYDFLVYATPEGTHIRPFAAGGVQFSSFFPPGSSASYGNQTTKFGINYGGGLKVRLTSIWGLRFDVRWYNTGKPFDLPNQSGRLNQVEASVGISFNL